MIGLPCLHGFPQLDGKILPLSEVVELALGDGHLRGLPAQLQWLNLLLDNELIHKPNPHPESPIFSSSSSPY
jgi:hypothetical protein